MKKLKMNTENKKTPGNDFSHFFLTASPKQRKKLILKAIHKANIEQRELIRSVKQ